MREQFKKKVKELSILLMSLVYRASGQEVLRQRKMQECQTVCSKDMEGGGQIM